MISGNACKDVFKSTHPGADCILYDDENCDGEEGVKELRRGESFMRSLEFDVESVSVRKGCFLHIYTGKSCLGPLSGSGEFVMHINIL